MKNVLVSLLSIFSFLLFSFYFLNSVNAEPVIFTFNPVADSYVAADAVTTNYGTSTQFRADGSPLVRSFVKFNVQGLSGTVTSAFLKIYPNSNHSTGFAVHGGSTTWTETTINYSNQPAFSATITGTSGSLITGTRTNVNVTPLVTANGEISFTLTTTSSTAMSLASKESANKPELIVTVETTSPSPTLTPTPSTILTPTITPTLTQTPSPTPTSAVTSTPTPSPTATLSPTPTTTILSPTPTVTGRIYLVSRNGNTYSANSQFGGPNYSGTSVKSVVESAMSTLHSAGGGTVQFLAGIFDLGTDYFSLQSKSNIIFAGQGIDVTFIQNNTNASADTEPFNSGHSNRITVRDMTVSAGGSSRSTSDALDFDDGSDNLIERVKVTASRARGIVFDGKDSGGSAERNVVRDSIIMNISTDGIELLASSNNQIINNQIYNVGGHGIQINKASTSAPQPNKKSNNNLISGNLIDNSGEDGIDLNSGDNNQIKNNTITNSSNVTANRDGIRILSSNNITCNNNLVENNFATDNQTVKTQAYGLNINSSLCNSNRVVGNNFNGNKAGTIKDLGTNTLYQ